MTQRVTVVEAQQGKTCKDFLEVPFIIQGKNPMWVPPLRVQAKELFDEKKNPWFKRGKLRKFVAYVNGKPAGRIAAIKDDGHNQEHNANDAHFGHFECVDDEEVAKALFAEVEKAGKEWGFDKMEGPFNPHINEDIGLLVEGFDQPPQIMMPYNPPYYEKLIHAAGYRKSMDLFTYKIHKEWMSEKLKRAAEVIRKRSKVRYRKLNMKAFWEDAERVLKVYRKAWEKNWNAVPMTDEEFHHLAVNLKQAVDPDHVFFAEDPETGETVGFSLALPNINEAIIKIRNGRLLPFGLLRLLWYTRPKAIKSVRIIVMGVLEEYRGRGIDTVFYYDHFNEAPKKGVFEGEAGWILETNTMMNRAAEMMGGRRNKVYRMYAKPL